MSVSLAIMSAGSASSLELLTRAWGVDFDPGRVVGDLQYGIGSGNARHIGIVSVPAAGLDQGDIVSADLEVVNLPQLCNCALCQPRQGFLDRNPICRRSLFGPNDVLKSGRNAVLLSAE